MPLPQPCTLRYVSGISPVDSLDDPATAKVPRYTPGPSVSSFPVALVAVLLATGAASDDTDFLAQSSDSSRTEAEVTAGVASADRAWGRSPSMPSTNTRQFETERPVCSVRTSAGCRAHRTVDGNVVHDALEVPSSAEKVVAAHGLHQDVQLHCLLAPYIGGEKQTRHVQMTLPLGSGPSRSVALGSLRLVRPTTVPLSSTVL